MNNGIIERLRGVVNREDRFCRYCLKHDLEILENKYHFVMVCPLYAHLRTEWLIRYTAHPTQECFINLMTSTDVNTIRHLGCFVYNAAHIHKMFNHL